MIRKRSLLVTVLVFFLFSIASSLFAAEYPDHEIRLIVPVGTGGSLDRMARSVQRFLPDVLNGTSVIVENRKGATTKIGTRHFMKQPPDGHTILVTLQPTLTDTIKKDSKRLSLDQFSIININWIDPVMLVAQKDLGWKSLDDMVQAVQANPGKFSFGHTGLTGAAWLACKQVIQNKKLDLDVKIVAYHGGGEARTALRGKHVDMTGGGAGGLQDISDVSAPLGVFWEEPSKYYPNSRPINEYLAKYDVKVKNVAAIRFFAVHREFKEKYPEKFKILVDAFHKLVTEHKGFQEYCDKAGIGREWYGPEKSQALVEEADRMFR